MIDPATFAGPCTAETPRCSVARSYHHALPACCRGHLRRMVSDLADECLRFGVRWWADYGTLLGAVRNPLTTAADYPWLNLPDDGPIPPGIIPHDKDVDVGALVDDWKAILEVQRAMIARGYHVKLRQHSVSLKFRVSERNHTNVDLFTWRNHGGVMHRPNYIQVDQFKGREFPADWVKTRTMIEWEGMMIPAPADPVAFCAHRYGDGWMSPRPANHDGIRRA